jgi:putative ABC transport system ATP-binding protein
LDLPTTRPANPAHSAPPAGQASAQIQARGLTKRMPSGGRELEILSDIHLEVAAGELLAIVGPSGSGKSTLLGLLAGLDRPSSGSVQLFGEELSNLSEDRLALLRRGRVGFVFQSFQLMGNLTARENISLPLELCGVSDAAERTRRALEEVGLSERGHHYPSQLSGGEQQRVAVARAFAADPAILFADEPTGNLDSVTGAKVLELLLDLRRRRGTTLVLVTHDASIASRAERQVQMFGGRIHSDQRRAGGAL